MSSLQHPTSLNIFQQFRQARTVLKETSRATSDAWYQEALDLDFQFHIRLDGVSIVTFFYNRSTGEWQKGIPISEANLFDLEQSKALGEALLGRAREVKALALGVVVHVADEFATAELDPELNNPAALNDLREKAYTFPSKILADSNVPPDQASWRVLPYPATGSNAIGTTISLSRRLDPFLTFLRETGEAKNFPIVTHTLSAPLVVLSKLPKILPGRSGKPFVAILQYPWLTALGFFNEHSDLRLIRTLQHRGLPRPANFRHPLSTTNASLEFIDPDLIVIPLGSDVDHTLGEDLAKTFPESRVETCVFPGNETLEIWQPEPVLSIEPHVEEEGQSHTFGALIEERWFLQDFLSAPSEVNELYPSKGEMRLLRFLKLGRIALVLITLIVSTLMVATILKTMRKEEWAFNAAEADNVRQRVDRLKAERVKMEHWGNMLADRSKAWVSMEALARLFPEDSGILVKNFVNTVRPDTLPGQAKVGFIREWKISGMARDKALKYLNGINTREGISEHFAKISEITGNTSFDPTPDTRSLVVNVKTQENSGFKPRPADQIVGSDESTYPFGFTLTITQRFESADPLAVFASKAP
ncbi:MAG: hypothetical protein ACSHX7_04830 [Luteolibacter sp.]